MILKTTNLSKLYKNNRGSRNVTLSIEPGEILGLLGPNGSGKTTIMKTCIGLLHPTSGEVEILDLPLLTATETVLRATGSLIESPSLFTRMTARQNMELARSYYPELEAGRTDEVLELVGLRPNADEKVSAFSLGMRQRLGIALALIHKPDLLILDEPANGLDIEGMVMIRDLVKAVAARGGGVLISSHLAHEIELCATHVAIMHDGNVLCVQTMESALEQAPSLEEFYLMQVTAYRQGGIAV
jgi:ABC-2 type transport system ATP-binding protein